MSLNSREQSWIAYDGECPWCSNYVALLRLRDSIGDVELVNARENDLRISKIKDAGLDLDEGMVFFFRGEMYHGARCVQMIAKLTEKKGFFGRVNHLIFRSSSRAKALYPMMRFVRNTTLKALRRKKIKLD